MNTFILDQTWALLSVLAKNITYYSEIDILDSPCTLDTISSFKTRCGVPRSGPAHTGGQHHIYVDN